MDWLVKGFWLTFGIILAVALALFAPGWIASLWAKFTAKHAANKEATTKSVAASAKPE